MFERKKGRSEHGREGGRVGDDGEGGKHASIVLIGQTQRKRSICIGQPWKSACQRRMRRRCHRKLSTVHLFAPASTTIAEPDLHARFRKSRASRDLFSSVDVGVVRPFERLFELVELFRCKRGATPSLLAIATPTAVRLVVRIYSQ